MTRPGSFFGVLRATASDFSQDQCGLRAAALSYYTVFALPPLLILLIRIAGLIWSPADVQHAIETQFAGLVGSSGASTVSQMVSSGQKTGHGIFAIVAGAVGLVLGATGAFLSLQDALNAVWEVGPDPRQGGVRSFLTKRLLSLGMVMALAFLLVVSLAITAALSALSGVLGGASIVMQIVGFAVSLAVLAVLFAALFKFLPDARVGWRSVWVGGIATAVMFEIGKFVIGLYLGHSNPGSAFGAASALAVILVWVYYAGMLVLFGAEFTQQFARWRGHAIEPRPGAVRIERQEQPVSSGESKHDAPREGGGRGDRARSIASARAAEGDGGGKLTKSVVGLGVAALLLRRSGRSGVEKKPTDKASRPN